MLRPLANSIFFIFEDDVTSTKFVNKASSGILIAEGQGDQVNIPRWGTTILVGPDVDADEVQPGDYILVEKGMWTTAFETDGLKLWKTDVTKVLLVSDEPATAY
jgi:hypothetical protein